MERNNIHLFEDKRIRTAWDEVNEEWLLSVVDVVAVLTDTKNPQTYWRVMKNAYGMKEIKALQIVTL